MKISETTSNSNPIRGGIIRQSKKHQKNKSRTKPRSFAKAVSAPIRRLYKLGRNVNDKNRKEKISEQQSEQLVEHHQHLIMPAHTFDTQEVVISPRSVESLIVGDSSSHFQEVGKGYQIYIAKEQQDIRDGDEEQEWIIRPSRAFDMDEVLSPRSFGSLKVDDSSSYIEEDEEQYELQIEKDEQQNSIYDEQSECQEIVCCAIGSSQLQPQLELDLEANLNEWREVESNISNNDIIRQQQIDPDNRLSITENEESSMSTNDEVDSLMPAMGDSLYFEDEDEDGDNDDDSNYLPPHQYPNEVVTSSSTVAKPPVKILNISIDYGIDIEGKGRQQKNYDEEEVGSSTSSYNSYLQAIGNITASTGGNAEKDVESAINKVDTVTIKGTDSEKNRELEEFHVSFTPSNGMYLQAMEGVSLRAKLDIERATVLALSRINIAAASISCKEADDDEKTKTTSTVVNAVGYSHNRVLGFLFFVFLFLGLSGNSLQFLENIRSISNFAEVNNYPTQQDNVVRTIAEEHMQLSIWAENQIAESASDDVSKKDGTIHDVVCAVSSSLFGPWLYFN